MGANTPLETHDSIYHSAEEVVRIVARPSAHLPPARDGSNALWESPTNGVTFTPQDDFLIASLADGPRPMNVVCVVVKGEQLDALAAVVDQVRSAPAGR